MRDYLVQLVLAAFSKHGVPCDADTAARATECLEELVDGNTSTKDAMSFAEHIAINW